MRLSRSNRLATTACGLLLALLCSASLQAQVCQVPAQFASISAAVSNPDCTEVTVASGTYADYIILSRSLAIVGAGPQQTTIIGAIQVEGSAIVELSELTTIASCRAALDVAAGARDITTNVQMENGGGPPGPDCSIFHDAFEL